MRNALGKGLDALLGSSFEMEQELNNGGEGKRNIQKISIDKIIPNRYQPRKNFDENALNDLAQSIKQHGLTQPVVVVYDAGLDKY